MSGILSLEDQFNYRVDILLAGIKCWVFFLDWYRRNG